MSFIDWSDPEALFDMLVEYTADEKTAAHGDAGREEMLGDLLIRLRAAQDQFLTANLPAVIAALRGIIESVDSEDRDDPVLDHFAACLEELERIKAETE